MDMRGDPRRVQLSSAGSDGRHQQQLSPDIGDDSFASACASVRTNKELCPYGCTKLLAPRTIDYHRLNGCRGKQEDAFADVSRKRSFTCGACYEEFVTREAFFSHLNNEHAVEASIRSEVFPDLYTFERFRFWLEAQGGAHYRQKSGAKTRPSGKGIFMMCNRSGLVHTTAATGEPEKDKLGSYRMGYTCTAFINGTVFPDGHVSVRYCGDHYGHDARVRLPQSVKNLIKHMQEQGTPNGLIIRYLQDHFIPFGHTSIHAQRAAYVDMEELRSITPMLKRINLIPFEKEEEWEQEFLETAGVPRSWGPAYDPRPAGWLPIKEFAEKMNWPTPLVYKIKVRNAAGEWMVFDDDRQGYVLETINESRIKTQHFLDHLVDDLEEPYEPKEERRGRREDREEENEDGEVDVEDVRENKTGEPRPVASTSAASSAVKKRRLEERGAREGDGRMEEEEEELEERIEGEGEGASNGRNFPRSGYLTSSIVAELEMIKGLVKSEADYLSEADLRGYLKQTRTIRSSLERLPTNGRSTVGQSGFSVPHVARHSRALPSRGRNRGFPSRTSELRTAEMRSQFSGGWPSSSSSMDNGIRKRDGNSSSMMVIDSHEIDVCDEEIVVGTSTSKLQYNARLWS